MDSWVMKWMNFPNSGSHMISRNYVQDASSLLAATLFFELCMLLEYTNFCWLYTTLYVVDRSVRGANFIVTLSINRLESWDSKCNLLYPLLCPIDLKQVTCLLQLVIGHLTSDKKLVCDKMAKQKKTIFQLVDYYYSTPK